MTDRRKRNSWEESDVELVEGTCNRTVGGENFEITLRREGSDWNWKARLAGEEETWACGTVSGLDPVGSAVTAISWDLFSRLVQESEDQPQVLSYAGAIPPRPHVDGIGKPWPQPAEGARAQEKEKPRMVLTRPGEDRSLEAYKAWINGVLVGVLGEEEAAKRPGMTEEEWARGHAEYWARVDEHRAQEDQAREADDGDG